MQQKTCIKKNYSEVDIRFFRPVVVAFPSSIYFGSYWGLHMGNLNMLKERTPQACLTKGYHAGCHTRWHGLESHLLLITIPM